MYRGPVTHRAYRRVAGIARWLPLVIGIVITIGLGMFGLWFTWMGGTVAEVAAGREPDIAVRAPVTLYMMIGYMPPALYYLETWTSRHVDTISTNFALHLDAFRFPRQAGNLLGIAGSVTLYLLFLHRFDDPFLAFQVTRWQFEYPFILFGLLVMGWFNFRFMFLLIWSALTVSRSARRIERIDLLDTASIEPYAQQGLQSSLLAIIGLSISANLWLDPNTPAVASATASSG